MSPVHSLTDGAARDEAIAAAADAVRGGRLVVVPTDTVYGVGADAFSPTAVRALLAAKQRGTDVPPPVLVPNARTLDGLAIDVPAYVRTLVREFWPGALTLVVRSQPSLAWDLGETNGTVALRMPDQEDTLTLLAEVGPMAVSSANVHGRPAATTVMDAAVQLGPAVDVYLDGGEAPSQRPSTILDCTTASPCVLRLGAVSVERIEEALGGEVHLRLSPSEPLPAGLEETPAAPMGGGAPAPAGLVPGGDALAAQPLGSSHLAQSGPGDEGSALAPGEADLTRYDLIPDDEDIAPLDLDEPDEGDERGLGQPAAAAASASASASAPVPVAQPDPEPATGPLKTFAVATQAHTTTVPVQPRRPGLLESTDTETTVISRDEVIAALQEAPRGRHRAQ